MNSNILAGHTSITCFSLHSEIILPLRDMATQGGGRALRSLVVSKRVKL
jgi:hypothetical protein